MWSDLTRSGWGSYTELWRWRLVICAALAGLSIAFAGAWVTAWVQAAGPARVTPVSLPRRAETHDFTDLVRQCAPSVAPNTMLAILRTESQFNTLALHVNGDLTLRRAPRTPAEAIGWSKWLIGRGYSVDLGLMQINSRNLTRLRMSVEDAFEPCRNIHGAAVILAEQYRRAAQLHGRSQDALLAAISAYNTGNFREGFRNGYVSKVLTNARAR